MEFVENLLNNITLQDIIEIASLITVIVGGCFALHQWSKGNIYKRAEIVEKLIVTVRDCDDIATVMDMIDWDSGFYYDHKFHLTEEALHSSILRGVSDTDFFKKIDKTLAHFSYICYLKEQHTLTKKDMRNFEYKIRRLIDNQHIANYLYSLYHWSASLGVKMSFSFLINYCIKEKYVSSDFKTLDSPNYICYLGLSSEYKKSKSKSTH